MISYIVAAPFGAFLGRHRGGFGGPWVRNHILPSYETGKTRIAVSTIMAFFLAFAAHDPYLLGLVPFLWLGFAKGWFDAADLGRDGDRSWLKEAGLMALRGLMLTAPAGLYLWALGYHWWAIPVGLLALPLGYELGHRTPLDVPNLHQGMEVAEAYTGLWLLELLTLTVSSGKGPILWGLTENLMIRLPF